MKSKTFFYRKTGVSSHRLIQSPLYLALSFVWCWKGHHKSRENVVISFFYYPTVMIREEFLVKSSKLKLYLISIPLCIKALTIKMLSMLHAKCKGNLLKFLMINVITYIGKHLYEQNVCAGLEDNCQIIDEHVCTFCLACTRLGMQLNLTHRSS